MFVTQLHMLKDTFQIIHDREVFVASVQSVFHLQTASHPVIMTQGDSVIRY